MSDILKITDLWEIIRAHLPHDVIGYAFLDLVKNNGGKNENNFL